MTSQQIIQGGCTISRKFPGIPQIPQNWQIYFRSGVSIHCECLHLLLDKQMLILEYMNLKYILRI